MTIQHRIKRIINTLAQLYNYTVSYQGHNLQLDRDNEKVFIKVDQSENLLVVFSYREEIISEKISTDIILGYLVEVLSRKSVNDFPRIPAKIDEDAYLEAEGISLADCILNIKSDRSVSRKDLKYHGGNMYYCYSYENIIIIRGIVNGFGSEVFKTD